MQYRHYDFPATIPNPGQVRPPVQASIGFGSWILIILVVMIVSAAVTFGAMFFLMRQGGMSAPDTPPWGPHGPDERWDKEAMPHEAMPHEAMPHEAMPHEAMPHEGMPREAMPGEHGHDMPGDNSWREEEDMDK